VKELQDKVAALEESFMKATEDKNAAIAQVRNLRNHVGGDGQGAGLCCLVNEYCACQNLTTTQHVAYDGLLDAAAVVDRLRRPAAKPSLLTGLSTVCQARTSAGVRPSRRWKKPAANW
jgi:hypothetical protein